MARFVLVLLGFASLASAMQLTPYASSVERANAQSKRGAAASEQGGVMCISLPTSDDPQFIRVLLDNIASFCEPSTKVALHLGARPAEEYTEEQIAQWNSSPNVVVTKERITVHPFQGSVFYAHILNAKTLEERWPGECDYFLTQASNMMWVRPGVEDMVRRNRYAELMESVAPKPSCLSNEPFYNEMIQNKGKQAWGQPEGAFFPMKIVNGLSNQMDAWLQKKHLDSSYFIDYKCYFEATYLQAFAVNYDDDAPKRSETQGAPCFRDMSGGNKKSGNTIPIEEIEQVIKGEGEFSHFYAVKRVQRNASHETTVFIKNMGQKSFDFAALAPTAKLGNKAMEAVEMTPKWPLLDNDVSNEEAENTDEEKAAPWPVIANNSSSRLSTTEEHADDIEFKEAQDKISDLEQELEDKNEVIKKLTKQKRRLKHKINKLEDVSDNVTNVTKFDVTNVTNVTDDWR